MRRRGARWRRTSIISKLALLMFAVGLPLVGILAWSLMAQFDLDRGQAEQHAVSHAIAAATRAEGVVEQTRSLLRAVAERPAVKALDPGHCDPFLEELRASLPHYANINTFNLRWEFVCSASLPRGKIVRSDYPALYERMKARGDMVLSPARRGQLTGRMVVIAAYPIRADGEVLGAVTAPIELSALGQSIEPEDGHDVLTQLADAAGAVIGRHPGGDRGELVLAAPLQAGPRGVFIAADRDGIERIHASAPVQGTDWIVTAALPTASDFAESGRRRTQVIAATLLAFALSAWVALVLSRRITRPLRELERDARIMAGGKFDHRSGVEGPDEVGQLAAAFNDMGRAVQQHEAVRRRAAKDLAERQQRLDGVVNSAMDAIVTIDEEGLIVQSNPAAHRMFGYTAAELFEKPVDMILVERFHAGQSRPVSAPGIGRRMAAPRVLRGLRKGGEQFPIEASISHTESTGSHYSTAILRDITERNRSDLQIRRLNRVHAVLTGINELIVRFPGRDELFREACRVAVEAGAFRMAWIGVIDPRSLEGRVVALHGGEDGYVDLIRLTARAGMPESERPACRALREGRPVICNDIATDPALAELREELLGRGHRSLGCFPLAIGGKVEGVLALFAGETQAFDEEETRLLLGLSGDISFALDHLEKQDRLDYLAYYDALTGLANRTLFLERVGQALGSAASGGHELAIFLVDLERFKNINDSLGRATGDALLRAVGQWLGPAGASNLVGRVGADQFAVILPKVRAAGSLQHFVEKRVAAFLEHPFRLEDAVLRVAIKVGVAVYPEDGTDAETLFRNAEAALKTAKATGERYLFHTVQMTEAVAEQLALENRLREAWDQRAFVLHYQPKVSLATGRLVGAEALVRWSDPRTGPVAPEVFLLLLEEMGLLVEVGRWALRQAVEDYLRWKVKGLPAVRIGVNLSPPQLRHRHFLAQLEEALAVGTDAAAGLELEISEGLMMEDVKHSIVTLEALRAMGVCVAIDDFGTGFSSLSQLARLPADTLKVDRSFVADMTTGPKGLALVSTIIALAHSLKLQVVAQGVETEEQSRLLGLLGCDAAQGGLICAPLPVDAFEARFLRAATP